MKPKWHWSNQKNKKEILDRISESKKGQHTSVATEFKLGRKNLIKGKKCPWAQKAAEGRRKSGMYKKMIGNTWGFSKRHLPWNKNKPVRLNPKGEFKRGFKPWNTGLGIGTPLNHAIRRLPGYKEWQKKILKRDDYTCQICDKRGEKLHIDHIKAFALICKENKVQNIKDALNCKQLWDIKNGRVLCVSCHRKTDTYSGHIFYSPLWKSINRV